MCHVLDEGDGFLCFYVVPEYGFAGWWADVVAEYPHTLERYAEVARFLGLSGNSDEELLEQLIAKIEALKERVGIKKTIRDYGVKEEDFLATLDEMVEQAFDDQCTGANPRYPLMSEIKAMYLKAYYGE